MPNPDIYADFVEFNVQIVAGSLVGTSISRCCLISTFEVMDDVFEDRFKAYSGTANQIRQALLDDGFELTSSAYKMADKFLLNVKPIGEVVIGRRDPDDADLAESLAAIIADDDGKGDDFFGFCVDTRLKAEQQYAFTWAEQRQNKFYLTYTRDPLALEADPASLPIVLEALQIKQGMLVWYDPIKATKYGPVVIVSAPGTFDVPNLGTLKLKVAGGFEQTFTFLSEPATLLSGSDGPYVLSEGTSIKAKINGGALLMATLEGDDEPIYFPDGFAAASAAQLAAWFNDKLPGVAATADGLKIRLSTTKRGTGATIEVFVDAESDMATTIDLDASEAQITTGTVVANSGDTVGLEVDDLADITVVSTASASGTATLLAAAWNASAAHAAVASATPSGANVTLTFFDHEVHTVAAVSPATADVTPIVDDNVAVDNMETGSGFADDAAAATGAEVATLIQATITGAAAVAQGTKFKITSTALGETAKIEITGGTLVDEFGLQIGVHLGVGVQENYLDCQLLGRIAGFDLDAPNGSTSYDDQTVPQTPGNILSNTQRKNIWNHGANTYEAVTSNRPGELHPGICPAKFDADVVWGAFWFRIRGSERVKRLQDTLADRGERIPYSEAGIARYDQVLRTLVLDGARNAILASPPDLLPQDPLGVRTTYFKTPTIAEQKPSDRAQGIVRGWEMVEPAAGAIKAIKINMSIVTP